ncbi:MAG: hypothetical protein D6702_06240 [Planctomycetota bacterium]|nr:MAG: hypothetical protein D6702_06240 [Planctomycetota bacterium]
MTLLILCAAAGCGGGADRGPGTSDPAAAIEVRGAELPRAELRSLIETALAHPEVEPPVRSVTVRDPNRAEVHTGVMRGPLAGGGQTVELERRDGHWVVVGVAQWIS